MHFESEFTIRSDVDDKSCYSLPIYYSEFMDVVDAKYLSRYGNPRYLEAGSVQIVWYQLHLVKAKNSRACISKEFKLFETFGKLKR